MTKKIVIIGPESSGKSVLTKALADLFNAPFVAEFARDYFEKKGTAKYRLTDIESIGRAQVLQVEQELSTQPELLFCDTDLITLKIWAADKFDAEIAFVEENLIEQKGDLYLLCAPDLPWQFDPLREDENRRDFLFDWNKKILETAPFHFKIVGGQGEKRLQNAAFFVREFLEK